MDLLERAAVSAKPTLSIRNEQTFQSKLFRLIVDGPFYETNLTLQNLPFRITNNYQPRRNITSSILFSRIDLITIYGILLKMQNLLKKKKQSTSQTLAHFNKNKRVEGSIKLPRKQLIFNHNFLEMMFVKIFIRVNPPTD